MLWTLPYPDPGSSVPISSTKKQHPPPALCPPQVPRAGPAGGCVPCSLPGLSPAVDIRDGAGGQLGLSHGAGIGWAEMCSTCGCFPGHQIKTSNHELCRHYCMTQPSGGSLSGPGGVDGWGNQPRWGCGVCRGFSLLCYCFFLERVTHLGAQHGPGPAAGCASLGSPLCSLQRSKPQQPPYFCKTPKILQCARKAPGGGQLG